VADADVSALRGTCQCTHPGPPPDATCPHALGITRPAELPVLSLESFSTMLFQAASSSNHAPPHADARMQANLPVVLAKAE
jgi:hypothetical protein